MLIPAALISLLFLSPAPRTFDIVSFTPPEGWKVDAGADRVTLTFVDKARAKYVIVGIYKAQPATGDLTADFKREWTDIIDHQMETGGAPEPKVAQLREGLTAAVGSASASKAGQPLVASLFVLDGGAQVASVLVLTPDEETLGGSPALVKLLGGMTLRRAEAAKTTITVADLTGEWVQGDGWSTDYVNSSGGYVGSQTGVYSVRYQIKASGAYTYVFGGMVNGKHTTDEDSGVISIEDGLVVVRSKKYKPKRYHFVSWQETDEGSAMTLLDANYALEQGNLIYRETWHRWPAKKK